MTTQLDEIDTFKLEAQFSKDHVSHPSVHQTSAAQWTRCKNLGKGGQGLVYLDHEEATGRYRAVKRLFVENYHNRGVGIRRELRHLIAVMDRTDLFVAFLGWFEDEGGDFLYIAMEYLPHGDLSDYIKEYGPREEEEAKDITRQLLDGLIVLHERKICHRDLKPQNILVASHSPIHIKLADFGISKSTAGTNLRTRIGTVEFLAPELQGFRQSGHSLGNEYTILVDMWALGCIVHWIPTGVIPFTSQVSTGSISIARRVHRFDMDLFSAFCSGCQLSVEELGSRLGDEGVSFVQGLLVADPVGRMTAEQARGHTWLAEG